jgi:hypothetical protein
MALGNDVRGVGTAIPTEGKLGSGMKAEIRYLVIQSR